MPDSSFARGHVRSLPAALMIPCCAVDAFGADPCNPSDREFSIPTVPNWRRNSDVVAPMLEHGKPKDIFVGGGPHMNRQGDVIWTQVVRPVLFANTGAEERTSGAAIQAGADT